VQMLTVDEGDNTVGAATRYVREPITVFENIHENISTLSNAIPHALLLIPGYTTTFRTISLRFMHNQIWARMSETIDAIIQTYSHTAEITAIQMTLL